MRHITPEQREKAEQRKESFRALLKRIAEMTDEQKAQLASKMLTVVNPDGHALSLHNTLLIAAQGGMTATIVGGFRQWLKQGRAVKKGEHGYQILFPREKKNGDQTEPAPDDTDKPEVRFLIGYVFDISQTMEVQTQRA